MASQAGQALRSFALFSLTGCSSCRQLTVHQLTVCSGVQSPWPPSSSSMYCCCLWPASSWASRAAIKSSSRGRRVVVEEASLFMVPSPPMKKGLLEAEAYWLIVKISSSRLILSSSSCSSRIFLSKAVSPLNCCLCQGWISSLLLAGLSISWRSMGRLAPGRGWGVR